MALFHFDSSALVKRYVDETGSLWLRGLCAPGQGNILSILELTRVEVAGTFARLAREGRFTMIERDGLTHTFMGHCLTEFRLLPVDTDVLDRAVRLVQAHPVRALDGLQLAAALKVNESLLGFGLAPITLVAADVRLIDVARSEGLAVENPNDHP